MMLHNDCVHGTSVPRCMQLLLLLKGRRKRRVEFETQLLLETVLRLISCLKTRVGAGVFILVPVRELPVLRLLGVVSTEIKDAVMLVYRLGLLHYEICF